MYKLRRISVLFGLILYSSLSGSVIGQLFSTTTIGEDDSAPKVYSFYPENGNPVVIAGNKIPTPLKASLSSFYNAPLPQERMDTDIPDFDSAPIAALFKSSTPLQQRASFDSLFAPSSQSPQSKATSFQSLYAAPTPQSPVLARDPFSSSFEGMTSPFKALFGRQEIRRMDAQPISFTQQPHPQQTQFFQQSTLAHPQQTQFFQQSTLAHPQQTQFFQQSTLAHPQQTQFFQQSTLAHPQQTPLFQQQSLAHPQQAFLPQLPMNYFQQPISTPAPSVFSGLTSPLKALFGRTGRQDTQASTFIQASHPKQSQSTLSSLFSSPSKKEGIFAPIKALFSSSPSSDRQDHGDDSEGSSSEHWYGSGPTHYDHDHVTTKVIHHSPSYIDDGYSPGPGPVTELISHEPHPVTFLDEALLGPTPIITQHSTSSSYWKPPPPLKVIKYFKDSVNAFRFTPYVGKDQLKFFSTLGHTLDATFGGAWAARKVIKKGAGTVLSSKLRLGGTLAYVGSEVLAKVVDAASSF